jgi:hypothetical protein
MFGSSFVAACRVRRARRSLVGGKRGRLLPLRRRAAARMYLDVFKDGSLVETYELSASKRVYRVGRQKGSADIVLEHGSISREQATLTVSASGTVVVVDLRSAHGTKLSGKAIEPNKPHTLPPGRSLTFGQSTRVFKLREGAASGFVSQPGIGQAAAAASFVLDDPRVQAVLAVLRNGHAQCGERLRPDGFVRLHAVLGCGPVQRAGCTEAELASLPAKLQTHVGASTDDDVHGHGTGEILLRALDDHAPEMRVDTSLQLTAVGAPDFPTASLPDELTFCASFREWNAVRSHGCGAGRSPLAPVRLCSKPPPRGFKAASLGGKSADLIVVIRTRSLLAEGLRLFRVDREGAAEAAEGSGGSGGSGEGATAAASAASASSASSPPPPGLEDLVCVGDDESGGAIGPWHFERVVNARDGSEMMGAAEVEPLREARAQKVLSLAAAAQAKLDAERARQAKREEKRLREEHAASLQADEPPAKRFNPYLAHMGDGGDEEDEDEG